MNQESEAMRLKEKHDKKILDLENEFKRRQVEDAEALQELKNECLEAKKNFKMAAQVKILYFLKSSSFLLINVCILD